MKTLETNHSNNWLDRLLNAWPLCLDSESVGTVAVAWDKEGVYLPSAQSLYYNGFAFLRLTFPFGIWLHVKPLPDVRLQVGVGWKLNGRIGATLRLQASKEAAAGTHGPNIGQARGFERGTA